MTPEQLHEIEQRASAATEGPWERGDVWQWAGVMPEMFGEGRCGMCNTCGDPVWIGEADINGETMLAHKHRHPDPYAYDYWISNEHGLVVGPYDYETGGVIDPADTEFITHARTDVPALVAEVRRLRGAVDAVRELHTACTCPISDSPHCNLCDGMSWPCKTLSAIDTSLTPEEKA